jgi:hypothetical protein
MSEPSLERQRFLRRVTVLLAGHVSVSNSIDRILAL